MNEKPQMVHKKTFESTNQPLDATNDVAVTFPLPSSPYAVDDYKAFRMSVENRSLTFHAYLNHFERLIQTSDGIQAELQDRFDADKLATLASRFGSWCAERSSKEENARVIYQGMLFSFLLARPFAYDDPTPREVAVNRAIRATTPKEFAQALDNHSEDDRNRTMELMKLLFE